MIGLFVLLNWAAAAAGIGGSRPACIALVAAAQIVAVRVARGRGDRRLPAAPYSRERARELVLATARRAAAGSSSFGTRGAQRTQVATASQPIFYGVVDRAAGAVVGLSLAPQQALAAAGADGEIAILDFSGDVVGARALA